MKLPTKPNSGLGLTSEEKLAEREAWLKLVVKVILWKEEPTGRNLSDTAKKITSKEWSLYRRRIIETNTTYSKERVLLDLESTFQAIKLHGGLEE